MIKADLILTIAALLVLLIALVILYVWIGKKKPLSSDVPEVIESFESLSAIIKERSSSGKELHHAVEMILNRFGHIHAHSIGKYTYLLEALCTHPKTDSKLILHFERTLRSRNPDFTHEIEKALAIGLASRG
jgi:hypothetical protein